MDRRAVAAGVQDGRGRVWLPVVWGGVWAQRAEAEVRMALRAHSIALWAGVESSHCRRVAAAAVVAEDSQLRRTVAAAAMIVVDSRRAAAAAVVVAPRKTARCWGEPPLARGTKALGRAEGRSTVAVTRRVAGTTTMARGLWDPDRR